MKFLKAILIVGALLSTFSLLVSCQQDYDMTSTTKSNESPYTESIFVYPYEESEGILDLTETYEIDSLNDFLVPLQPATEVFKTALENGLVINYNESMSLATRASMSNYKVYESRDLVFDEDLQKKMYFKSKFGTKIVNEINAIASPELQISTGTTYCCRWQVYYHPVTVEKNQKFGICPSPKCGLIPSTRTSYVERGYEFEKKSLNDGSTKYEMYTFTVLIMYKDTNNKTIRLDVEYPIRTSADGPGYEFIYNILTI